jgi:hypothetical protein
MYNTIYTVYLEQKDPLAYTGPEHHAALMFQDKNNFARLIPIKKALAFRRTAGTIRETQGKLVDDSAYVTIGGSEYCCSLPHNTEHSLWPFV